MENQYYVKSARKPTLYWSVYTPIWTKYGALYSIISPDMVK